MTGLVGLIKRGNVWTYRVRVPSDIQSVIGRKELKKSLKTTDYRVAVHRFRRICSQIEIQFEEARYQIQASEFHSMKVGHKTGTQVSNMDHISTLDSPLNVSAPNQKNGMKSIIRLVTEEVLSSIDPDRQKQKPISIRELYELYMSDPAKVRSPKAIIEYNSVFLVLSGLIGEDTSIQSIDRSMCRQVMEVLRHLPPRAKKRYPNKDYSQISEIARKKELTPIAPATVNKHLSNLSALFNWAVKEGLINRNPAVGLSVADNVRAKDKRLPFTNEQLLKIFSDPIFTHRAYGDKPSRYWVPLIGLQGLRLNEICQLNVEDIKEFEGVPCFNVTETVKNGPDDKVIKTASSERIMPIHPKLIELGLLNYQKSLPTNGKLFPDIRMAVNGYRSDTFTKYFQRFLKKVGAKEKKNSYHSFRHNFKDNAHNSRIPHTVILALGGWVGDAGVEAAYGRGYSARVLLEEIEKIDFQFL